MTPALELRGIGKVYPPPASATSAVTGTASTPRTDRLVTFTVTGAWSRLAAASGAVSVTIAGTVAWAGRSCGPCCGPGEASAPVAPVETDSTRPAVVSPAGRVTVTASPPWTR